MRAVARAYLGVGSNLGDRVAAFEEATARLRQARVTVVRRSPVYETEPWGITEQPRFLNAAWEIESDLPPQRLLALLKAIEHAMGRREGPRNGPRVIDLDILTYEDLVLETETLQVPHPGMLQRATVLVPLADIAGGLRHPVSGSTIAEHLGAIGAVTGVALYPPGLS